MRSKENWIITEGPFVIIQINKNGTVKIQRNSYQETIHLRRIKPYNEEEQN